MNSQSQPSRSLTAILFMALLSAPVAAQFAIRPAGLGTPEEPYRIRQLGELVWAQDPPRISIHYRLENDIDAAETENWAGGFKPVANPRAPFLGTFVGAEKLFLKFSDVDRPSPSQLFVFIEENADSLNDPALSNSQLDHRWIDLPGAYHPTTETNRASNLAFADGHVESHAWSESVLGERPDFNYSSPTVRSGNPDRAWLLDRTSYIRSAVR